MNNLHIHSKSTQKSDIKETIPLVKFQFTSYCQVMSFLAIHLCLFCQKYSVLVVLNKLTPVIYSIMMMSSNRNIFRVTGHLWVNSPHKGQWRGTLMFCLICVWINGWVNNREAGDLRCPLWRHCNVFQKHWNSVFMLNTTLYLTGVSRD